MTATQELMDNASSMLTTTQQLKEQETFNLECAKTLIEDVKRIYAAYFCDLNEDIRTETSAATFKYY